MISSYVIDRNPRSDPPTSFSQSESAADRPGVWQSGTSRRGLLFAVNALRPKSSGAGIHIRHDARVRWMAPWPKFRIS